MEQHILENLIEKGLSQRLIAKKLNCSQTTIRWWLKKFNIKPKEKDLNFISLRGWKKVRLIKELDKCILLCSNCHQELHDKIDKGVSPSLV